MTTPHDPRRAEAPRIPASTPAIPADLKGHRRRVEARERRSMVRGLLFLAVLILLMSIARAGLDRVFPEGWWHR